MFSLCETSPSPVDYEMGLLVYNNKINNIKRQLSRFNPNFLPPRLRAYPLLILFNTIYILHVLLLSGPQFTRTVAFFFLIFSSNLFRVSERNARNLGSRSDGFLSWREGVVLYAGRRYMVAGSQWRLGTFLGRKAVQRTEWQAVCFWMVCGCREEWHGMTRGESFRGRE